MEYQCVNCGNVTDEKGNPLQLVAELPTRVGCCQNPNYKIADELLHTDKNTA